VIETLLRDLRQPEYIHVLINPLPIYGLAIGWIGLIIAVILKSRRAQIATLSLVLISSVSAWPAFEFGEQGYDRVLAMTDEDGHAWLDEHMHRAERFIYAFYALAALSAAAIAIPIKWPKSSGPLVISVSALGALAIGMRRTHCRLAGKFGIANSGTNRLRRKGRNTSTIKSTL
jgi:hypothetical protein